jgi:hypothetical protein
LSVPEPNSGAARIALSPPFPNPSRGTATLRFTTVTVGPVSVEIYDLLGRRVRQWRWPALQAGAHEVTWDGRDEMGRPVGPGILFCRLSADGRTSRQKMAHLN